MFSSLDHQDRVKVRTIFLLFLIIAYELLHLFFFIYLFNQEEFILFLYIYYVKKSPLIGTVQDIFPEIYL